MRVLLVGSGGREHALGWKLVQSRRVDSLISLPGNPGLSGLGATVEGIDPSDVGAVAAMARLHKVDLVVVGPEAPLAAGIVDALNRTGVPAFGPSRAAARLESSKAFAKQIMALAGVPTADSASFTETAPALQYLQSREAPFVVKADGLAAGKGVLVTDSLAEASAWVDRWVYQGPVVIEDFLDGPELSVFAVCTEKGAVALEPARDYKRLLNGDHGPNTGGMGSFSPVADLPAGFVNEVVDTVVKPTLETMREQGHPFLGFLYVGLALTSAGPKVVEFNARLGDPETQALMPRMTSDLVDVLEGASPSWSDQAVVNVVLAAEGYPETPRLGDVVKGLGTSSPGVEVFHAGTRFDENGRVVSSGGRVLNVVGVGDTLDEARDRAYQAAETIRFPGKVYRTDIAGGVV